MRITSDHNVHSKRKTIFIGTIIITGLILLVRLFYIQVIDHTYKLSATSNVMRYITDYPARGLIYDREGRLLVSNETHYDLMVIPRQVRNIDTLEFCNLLGIDVAQFESRMMQARRHSHFRPSVFERQISKNTFAFFQEKLFRFPGFFVQPRTLRNYTYPIAAHTFGYVGEAGPTLIENDPYYRPGDYVGISGIERYYEEELRGRKGVRIRMVDVLNREIGPYQGGRFDTIAETGKDLYTTLDAELQLYGERLMQNKRGSIVAIEPSSGEILALVSSPSYDPNLLVGRVRTQNYRMLQNDTLKPLFNRALMAQYPPGSAFKVVNTLIAMQEGVVNLHTRQSCSGAYHSGGITVRCRQHPNPVNIVSSIQYSCNTFSVVAFRNTLDQPRFLNMQEAFNNWRDHVTSFGFGRVFGNDLAHELSGLIVSSDYYDRIYGPRGWRSLTIVSLSIGQGEVGTTPVQLANLAATVANRGHYYTPHIVRAIATPDSLNPRFREPNQTTVDRRHFEVMADAMHEVVLDGTGRFSRMQDIEMGGKTGTVQNPHGENHSVFIAFAPVDDPKIAISVVVENAGSGAAWAAPIASLMIEKYLNGETQRHWFENRILEASFLNPRP
jgi:penicillin-binding protein 2